MFPDDNGQPPQAPDAERAVLGCILKSGSMDSVISIIPDHNYFYAPKHRKIYRAMKRLFERSEPTDITMVIGSLHKSEELVAVGGRVYLVDLQEKVASTVNAPIYARLVADKHVRRRVISSSNEIIKSAYETDLETPALVDAWQRMALAANRTDEGGFSLLSADNAGWLAQIDDLQSGREQERRVKTGFAQLDNMVQGFAPTELITIAADTGNGKTQFALQVALNVAMTQGWGVAIQSLEMTKREVNSRIQCTRAFVDYANVEKPGALSDSDMDRLVRAAKETEKAKIYVDERGVVSPENLIANSRQVVAKHDVKLLIIDYLQLLSITTKDQEKEYQTLAALSNSMKMLAKDLGVVVMAVSQITAIPGQPPGMASFRGSKAIGFAANFSIFLWHNLKDKPVSSWMFLEKSRRGPSHQKQQMKFVRGQWTEVDNFRKENER